MPAMTMVQALNSAIPHPHPRRKPGSTLATIERVEKWVPAFAGNAEIK